MRLMRRFVNCCILMLCSVQLAGAETLPQWNVEDEVFEAKAIVRGALRPDGRVVVKEVWLGTSLVGQVLTVKDLPGLSRRKFADEAAAVEAYWQEVRRSNTIRPDAAVPKQDEDVQGDLVLFLEGRTGDTWTLCSWGSGVKWLTNGQVAGYYQLMNPGGYWLLTDQDTPTEAELRQAIVEALSKKRRYEEAVALIKVQDKINALAFFVQPARVERLPALGARHRQGYFYFRAALEELSKIGPQAGQFLREQAQRPDQQAMRPSFLIAIGHSRDHASVPYLIGAAQRAALIAKPLKEQFEWHTLTAEQTHAVSEWTTCIYALSDLQDLRAVPVLREALLWGAQHSQNDILESAARGLSKLPQPDNVAVLSRALSSIAPAPYDWVAVEYCLQALRAHHFPESVPVLAAQLEPPAAEPEKKENIAYNIQIAHEALVEITGEDVGLTKRAWMNWFRLNRASPLHFTKSQKLKPG